ncbi:MAG: hypothetical protein DRJ98_02025 [Thermoprotei archaeon]|nr:MAG: hypothetical protein DRJ98_02025 [Thermoprotei archaeon]
MGLAMTMLCSLCRTHKAQFTVEELYVTQHPSRSSTGTMRFAVCRSCLNAYLDRLKDNEKFIYIEIKRLDLTSAPKAVE